MSDSKDKKPAEIGNGTENQTVSIGRRKFTKAGLLTSPILMAVTSQPVFAANCLSNRLSGNLSDPNRGTCILGLSPGYWKNKPEEWPSPLAYANNISGLHGCVDCGTSPGTGWSCSGGTRFNDIFTTKQDPDDRSLAQIICTENAEHQYGARHIIAAYINSIANNQYVLSTSQVLELWADPTLGGQQLYDLKTFLDSTWV